MVFERREIDGREHSPWILRAELADQRQTDSSPGGTRLMMTLHYGGSLWAGAALHLVLDEQIRAGSRRLLDLVSDEPTH